MARRGLAQECPRNPAHEEAHALLRTCLMAAVGVMLTASLAYGLHPKLSLEEIAQSANFIFVGTVTASIVTSTLSAPWSRRAAAISCSWLTTIPGHSTRSSAATKALFEVSSDTATGQEYLRGRGRRAVVGVADKGDVLSTSRPLERIAAGVATFTASPAPVVATMVDPEPVTPGAAVEIPAGATSGTFQVNTFDVTAATSASIKAAAGEKSRSATRGVVPPRRVRRFLRN